MASHYGISIIFFSTALGWFAHVPEWYEANSKSFEQSEAQSVSIFVHYLLNESPSDQSQKANGREGDLSNLVSIFHLIV
jgi:phosphatidylinositol 4-kinase A